MHKNNFMQILVFVSTWTPLWLPNFLTLRPPLLKKCCVRQTWGSVNSQEAHRCLLFSCRWAFRWFWFGRALWGHSRPESRLLPSATIWSSFGFSSSKTGWPQNRSENDFFHRSSTVQHNSYRDFVVVCRRPTIAGLQWQKRSVFTWAQIARFGHFLVWATKFSRNKRFSTSSLIAWKWLTWSKEAFRRSGY